MGACAFINHSRAGYQTVIELPPNPSTSLQQHTSASWVLYSLCHCWQCPAWELCLASWQVAVVQLLAQQYVALVGNAVTVLPLALPTPSYSSSIRHYHDNAHAMGDQKTATFDVGLH